MSTQKKLRKTNDGMFKEVQAWQPRITIVHTPSEIFYSLDTRVSAILRELQSEENCAQSTNIPVLKQWHPHDYTETVSERHMHVQHP